MEFWLVTVASLEDGDVWDRIGPQKDIAERQLPGISIASLYTWENACPQWSLVSSYICLKLVRISILLMASSAPMP